MYFNCYLYYSLYVVYRILYIPSPSSLVLTPTHCNNTQASGWWVGLPHQCSGFESHRSDHSRRAHVRICLYVCMYVFVVYIVVSAVLLLPTTHTLHTTVYRYLLFNTAVSSTWGFPSPCPEDCPCTCFDCRAPACACAVPANMCSNLPAHMLIDYVRVYQDSG